MSHENNLSVGGYVFYTEKDAKLAEAELKKIDYLEARIDYGNPEGILRVYEKSIHERIFKTPVGLDYLKRLRAYLLEQQEINPEDVPDISLFTTFSSELRQKSNPTVNRIKEHKDREENAGFVFRISVILNVLLILAIIAMFTISLRSDNPNILNYERNITNKYASWEEQLKEREAAVREKERELKLGDFIE